MKNKEIEELLNKMKNCNGVFDYYLEYGEVDLLLSYIEQLEKKAELGDHYKHLYSEVKKQKYDVVEYIKENEKEYGSLLDNEKIILRMLGEIDE